MYFWTGPTAWVNGCYPIRLHTITQISVFLEVRDNFTLNDRIFGMGLRGTSLDPFACAQVAHRQGDFRSVPLNDIR